MQQTIPPAEADERQTMPYGGRSVRPLEDVYRPSHRRCGRFLLTMLLLAPAVGTAAGCAAEDKKPQTVTEWMRQPRVGDPAR